MMIERVEPVRTLIRWRIASDILLTGLLLYLVIVRFHSDIILFCGLITYAAIRLIARRRFQAARQTNNVVSVLVADAASVGAVLFA